MPYIARHTIISGGDSSAQPSQQNAAAELDLQDEKIKAMSEQKKKRVSIIP